MASRPVSITKDPVWLMAANLASAALVIVGWGVVDGLRRLWSAMPWRSLMFRLEQAALAVQFPPRSGRTR